jgi:formamidopyrimidine-DNA glycosylase
MPELPEVETVRRDLQRVVRGKRVSSVRVKTPKILRAPDGKRLASGAPLARRLRNKTISKVGRRGKLLIIHLGHDDTFLLVHLKMTGQLIYRDRKRTVAGGHGWPRVTTLPSKHTHAIISLTGGGKLFFNDLRQFGFLRVVDSLVLEIILGSYGPEPLSPAFTPDYLRTILRGRKTALKNVLLNQALIAGLGNIYVDEACFRAGIRPGRKASRVTGAEVKRLHRAIREVLKAALKERGTTFGNFRDGLGGEGRYVKFLKVYGRSGELCKKCRKGIIARATVAGRGTAYCPVCQK